MAVCSVPGLLGECGQEFHGIDLAGGALNRGIALALQDLQAVQKCLLQLVSAYLLIGEGNIADIEKSRGDGGNHDHRIA